jgi:SAM-dependent methyltransferase
MTEPGDMTMIRTSYDTVAVAYAALLRDALAEQPVQRGVLATFAELVRRRPAGPVLDAGCGPGHIAAHLGRLGLDVFGIDLSPAMVQVARQDNPGLRFDVGSMLALDLPSGTLAGVLSWWSMVHTPLEQLPAVFGELARVLAPGGELLVGFHGGIGRTHKREGYGGHPMSVYVHRWSLDRIAQHCADAGLHVHTRISQDPPAADRAYPAMLLASKPGQPATDPSCQ